MKTFVEVNITLGAFNIFFMEIITEFCTDPEVEQFYFIRQVDIIEYQADLTEGLGSDQAPGSGPIVARLQE